MILHDFLSFEALRLIWWGLMGMLFIGFALTDGFDMGVGALLPFVAKTDTERRLVIHSIAPVWEGNQVWFILGGGAIFAAWPPLYAVSFSGFYLAMFMILAALILRPVAIKYRSKRADPVWRERWDKALFVGSAAPALLFGVAVGNVLLGVPFRLTPDLMSIYEGGTLMKLLKLLRPFALLTGVVSVSMLVMHGAAWLSIKTDGPVKDRARRIGTLAGLVAAGGYALGGLVLAGFVDGYAYTGAVAHDGPSNPLYNEVVRQGSWLSAYAERPWIIVAPVMGFLGIAGAIMGLRAGRELTTFLCSKVAVTGIIASVGLTMFPFILPSNVDPNSSLTVWDASSSHLTLFVMLVGMAIFMPLILMYTAWVYKVLWGKVSEHDVNEHAEY
ncbi:cytochrome d ubiquinol oxidase subunit II [Sagittula salina]|uniref:Cytochrome d ubiquinol oxidase subunit II n=1 Tax=Sagittula salina TaxID=2820268 RepID=A0A940MTI2_9RHOB|nr:cytochrome d ubiquinol oxidase subunit II [Sagittula salina]MBP0482684.1 cytochrome d ubiquinol oxidase subunit II [Sagittula salina]